jgi:hypothetical protein
MQYVTFTASQNIRTIRSTVYGWNISNNGGGANVIHIHDSIDGSGPIVFRVTMNAGETKAFAIAPVPFNTGVYAEVVSGSAIGTLFVE